MRKFQRVSCPGFLVSRWQQWGIEWEARLAAKPAAAFHWHRLNNTPVNQLLLPPLMEQTQSHCSYCDSYPVSPPSRDTIDHWQPKSEYPLVAYQWENLYYCCDFCQQKFANFDPGLLRPDAPDYAFDRYFRYDFTTGELKVNELASAEDQRRAQLTITTHRLNVKHPAQRKIWLRWRELDTAAPIDEFPYRDFVG